jgi:hypothetical protein
MILDKPTPPKPFTYGKAKSDTEREVVLEPAGGKEWTRIHLQPLVR